VYFYYIVYINQSNKLNPYQSNVSDFAAYKITIVYSHVSIFAIHFHYININHSVQIYKTIALTWGHNRNVTLGITDRCWPLAVPFYSVWSKIRTILKIFKNYLLMNDWKDYIINTFVGSHMPQSKALERLHFDI